MKRPSDALFSLTPQAEGWAVWRDAQRQHVAPTLSEALALLPGASAFEFAMPCYPLIIERLRLPATEREDLAGMMQLQWEKSLPFSPEEIVGAFMVLGSTDGDSVVWSVAAALDSLAEFDETWSKANRWPQRVAPYVCHVAASCPAGETVLVLYVEQRHWVVAVVEDRRPGWVQVMSASDAAGFATEFPSLMLTLGMDDVPSEFARVLVAPEIVGCEDTLRSVTQAPIEALPLITPAAQVDIDLLPPHWQVSAQQHQQGKAWRKRALAVAAVCLVFVVAGIVDLLVLQYQSSRLESELKAQRPALSLLQTRQARFNSLAPAVDPHHYAIELLFLLNRCLPGESVRLTEFDQMPQEWRVVGEAASASQAIDYLSRLKHDPDLGAGDISADPPRLLANEKAQFQVIGKP
ncbi:hypothetical protein CfE428DRAFT_5107 [Chthoniobacter flavus Ellin428]|uniref:Fimbrial assembly family protein n=1 Tax=Chthoniobacter flavus Ellin428 TaxID=497964 RepID=B4D867_9BACT|nr:hypothetical protein [Chthoniobacter flavus]EDY17421.1 hypothetical protein CfE428DRAFT_5107 [Chthoniobacter flavus Ellin428]TCO87332.1 type II secretory pathway component PulL [Chthoniobacter flavus]